MAASSSSSSSSTIEESDIQLTSSWKTDAWSLPFDTKTQRTCGYCGHGNPPHQCTSCRMPYCGAECQEQAWYVHKFFCHEDSNLAMIVEKLTSSMNLSAAMSISWIMNSMIEHTRQKVFAGEKSDSDCFADIFDELRASSLCIEQTSALGSDVHSHGRLYMLAEDSNSIDAVEHHQGVAFLPFTRDDLDNFMFTEESLIFYALLATLCTKNNRISGEMAAMHLCITNHMFFYESSSERTFIGLNTHAAEEIQANKYMTQEMQTEFNGEEILAAQKADDACYVYIVYVSPTLSTDTQTIDNAKQSHMLALVHFRGEYCVVQSYMNQYSYHRWLSWNESLKHTPRSPSNELAAAPCKLLDHPRFRRPSLSKKDVGDFFSGLNSLTYPGNHRRTYADLTGVLLSKDERANVYNVKCSRFNFSQSRLI